MNYKKFDFLKMVFKVFPRNCYFKLPSDAFPDQFTIPPPNVERTVEYSSDDSKFEENRLISNAIILNSS